MAIISNFPPQAYIIGAPKAATTSLASLLSQHPGITLSEPKEPDFFTNNWEKGLDWYRGCFARDDTLLLDASTTYAMAQVTNRTAAGDTRRRLSVPSRIFELRPDAKFIYMVRNPAARTYSAYWHDARESGETRPLRRVVAEDPGYLDPGFYYAQTCRYLEYFDLSRFHFVRFEEFIKDPLGETRRAAQFLGVAPFAFVAEPVRNESFQYNWIGRMAHDLMGKTRLKKISIAVREMIPAAAHRVFKGFVSQPISRMTKDEAEWLSSFFVEDVAAFEKLLGSARSPGAPDRQLDRSAGIAVSQRRA